MSETIKMQFKINDINVTVKHHESVFTDNRVLEKYIFEKDGETFSSLVERLDASMHEVAIIILSTNINLV